MLQLHSLRFYVNCDFFYGNNPGGKFSSELDDSDESVSSSSSSRGGSTSFCCFVGGCLALHDILLRCFAVDVDGVDVAQAPFDAVCAWDCMGSVSVWEVFVVESASAAFRFL